MLFAFLMFFFIIQKYGSAGIHAFFSETAARNKRETATPLAFFVESLLSGFENTLDSFLKQGSAFNTARGSIFSENRNFVSWVSPFWQEQKYKQTLLWVVACVGGFALNRVKCQRRQLVYSFYTVVCTKKITTLSKF